MTRIVISTGKKGIRSPVCKAHEEQFVRGGAESERTLMDKQYGKKQSGPPVIK